MDYPSISGISNKYDWGFTEWLFGIIEHGVVGVIQIGFHDGYLSSLFLLRVAFSKFRYLSIGEGEFLPFAMKMDEEHFHLFDCNNVESVSKANNFIMTTLGKCLIITEDMRFGPLFYWPIMKPGDILLAHGRVDSLIAFERGGFNDWIFYIK